MKTTHLSAYEQEECVIDRPTPQMLRHLNECVSCRTAVDRLQHNVAIFRSAAKDWSTQSLAARPRPLSLAGAARRPIVALRWAVAAVVPLVLMALLLLVPHPTPRPVQPVPAINDDALLDQVDQQLSVAVPESMESLTHLVSAQDGSGPDTNPGTRESRHLVQPN